MKKLLGVTICVLLAMCQMASAYVGDTSFYNFYQLARSGDFVSMRQALRSGYSLEGENSGGDTISFGLIERFDCRDWVLWVNEHIGRELPIYLCGVSMGASTVLMASGLDLPNVHGIIADCGYTSPRAIWKHVANNNLHIAFGLRGAIADEILKQKIQMSSDEYSTTEALRNSQIPVIFIHGADDHFVPVTMTYENYLACASPKRLLIVPGADHGQSSFVERERYEDEVKRFWADFD